jgi:hypothetical protein
MISLIKNAKKRIVYLAPSISKVLAEAIVAKKFSLSVIEIIIDPDPEVYRLGYGEIEEDPNENTLNSVSVNHSQAQALINSILPEEKSS